MKHANMLGGSTVERRLECYGSAVLEKSVPKKDSPPSEAALRGNALHKAMEKCMERGWKEKHLVGYIGTTYENCYRYSTKDIKEGAFPAFRAIDDLFADKDITLCTEVDLFIDDNIGGTSDLIAFDREAKTLYVVDYKFGQVPVSPVKNKSLAFYLMAFLEGNSSKEWVEENRAHTFKRIVFVIIQPTQERTLNTWELSNSWFFDVFAPQIRGLINFFKRAKAEEYSWPFGVENTHAGHHCKFCRVKPSCPTYNKNKIPAAAIDNDNFTLPIPLHQVHTIRPSEMGTYLDWANGARKLADKIFALGADMAREGHSLKNYVLSPTIPRRTYIDKKAAAKVLEELLDDGAYTMSLLTPAQAERELGKKTYEEKISPLVETLSSGDKLSRVFDPTSVPQGIPVSLDEIFKNA